MHDEPDSGNSANREVKHAVLTGQSPLARRHFRRNFGFGVINGILVMAGQAFFHPTYVVAVLLFQLTGLKAFAGLMLFVDVLGWNWPQLWVSHRMEGQPRALPWYRKALVVRVTTYLGLLCVVYSLRWGGAGWVYAIIIVVLVFAYRTGVGFAGVPFYEVVCKTVPVGWRGRYFGLRRILGGILAALSGLLVQRFLKGEFPQSYFWIFLWGFWGLVLGPALFTFVKEPPGDVLPRTPSFFSYVRRTGDIFRHDAAFRKLVGFSVFFGLANWGRALYGIYCIERLGVQKSFMGDLIALDMTVTVVSNLIWTYLSDRHGNRIVLRWASFLVIIAPLGLLLASIFKHLAMPIVLVSMGLGGFAGTAHLMGWLNMLLEIAPGDTRPRYVGLMNLIKMPLSAFPMLAGILADQFSYGLVFGIAILSSLVLIIVSRGMPEPRRKLEELKLP